MSTILTQKYPAKEHARRVAKWITEHGGDPKAVIYLEAQKMRMKEDNDEPAPFRQRRYFYYLTGCELADSYFTYDMSSGKSTLYIPPVNPDDVMWSGLPMNQEEALARYEVDSVLLATDINAQLASEETSKSTIYAINNQVAEHITFLPFNATNFDLLKPAIEACRVAKTPYEVALIRKANEVSTTAHTAVMKAAQTASNEQELEAIFLKNCIERGLKEQAYHGIFASGTSCATLHYFKNDAPLEGKLNLLIDAGAEYSCYASDITRTFPINGKFTNESRAIYSLVLRMQEECTNMLKAGMIWDDVHIHAHKVGIQGLLSLGILRGDPKEIFDSRTSAAFFPHGLGHHLGMDTHDTGGNPNYADSDPMFRYLRIRGTVPAGSVVTVEPGIYFCRFIIEPYLKDKKHAQYIDREVLERYWEVGGVRIEDNILITESGFENLTTTPKAMDELEHLVGGA